MTLYCFKFQGKSQTNPTKIQKLKYLQDKKSFPKLQIYKNDIFQNAIRIKEKFT